MTEVLNFACEGLKWVATNLGVPLVTGVIVPIMVGLLAAGFIGRQIRQLDRHRTEDRLGEAIIELSNLLSAETKVGLDPETSARMTLYRFELNHHLIRAYALLPATEHDVVAFVARTRDLVQAAVNRSLAEGENTRQTVGDHRAEAFRVATLTMDGLIQWQAGV
ncbi:MAG TPA: hypothetical protein VK181_02460, partial [Rhizobium sp.]|nr:hypothetical protein [Rhizobium sp.]